MILITSGAYANEEFRSEFGYLPPAFLPLQNKRLFEHQIKLFENFDEKIFITVPEDYELHVRDLFILERLNVKIIKVPKETTLGFSISFALNIIGSYDEPLKILHGDTLFNSIIEKNDVFYVSHPKLNHSWGYVNEGMPNLVFSGYFSFSNQILFIKNLAKYDFDFIQSVKKYSEFQLCEYDSSKIWYDFGSVNSYYLSRSNFTTERAFNNLVIDKNFVTKSSNDDDKIFAEYYWYKKLPKSLAHFLPVLYDSSIETSPKFYQLEHLYLSNLANIFVFGIHPTFVWEIIFENCQLFLKNCFLTKKEDDFNQFLIGNSFYLDKSQKRLKEFSQQRGIDLDICWNFNGVDLPSLNEILTITNEEIAEASENFKSIIHGDFCLSNILYDFRKNSIKVIDPRGRYTNDELSIYGDFRYDVAKLSHSIIGLYDFILADAYDLKLSEYRIQFEIKINNNTKSIQEQYNKMFFLGYNLSDLSTYPIMINLFLSMLPLHYENKSRQDALLSNALRLYVDYKNLY
jgi:hypothetical protein